MAQVIKQKQLWPVTYTHRTKITTMKMFFNHFDINSESLHQSKYFDIQLLAGYMYPVRIVISGHGLWVYFLIVYFLELVAFQGVLDILLVVEPHSDGSGVGDSQVLALCQSPGKDHMFLKTLGKTSIIHVLQHYFCGRTYSNDKLSASRSLGRLSSRDC